MGRRLGMMRKSRFSDEQIIAILKEHEAGVPTADLYRKHDSSPASFYKSRAKFGGMEISDAKKLLVYNRKCERFSTLPIVMIQYRLMMCLHSSWIS